MKKLLKTYSLIFLSMYMIISCSGIQRKSEHKTSTNQKAKKDTLAKPTNSFVNKVDTFETLGGWLKLSLNQKNIIDSIGQPDKKSKDEFWEATSTFVQHWEYELKGIELEMESNKENEAKEVMMITIMAPCSLRTSQNIGIGSDINLVKEKYQNLINKSSSDDKEIVVGSIYGGTIFSIENGKVSKIFIGAAAE